MHTNYSDSSLIAVLVRHYDELVDHLRRRFGDTGFAREVMQDVCVQLLERPPREDIKTPQIFLRHVSTQLAIDRYRVEQARARVVAAVEELPETAIPHLPLSSGELAVAFQQKQQALLEAVQALPERCQEVFILHKLYHMPQADVAAKLGISRGMVARHMARAGARLSPVMRAK
ncbi:MAG TPA: RNA polymerase sigma factor [Oxalicibacterium sp.]|nr:RNA polymerase sigma factor [Oxalicibacterium sp.]